MPTCPALHREAASLKQQPEQPPAKRPTVPLGCPSPALPPCRAQHPDGNRCARVSGTPHRSASQLHLLTLLPAGTSGCAWPRGAGRRGPRSLLLHEPRARLRSVQEPCARLEAQAEAHEHSGRKPEQRRVLQTGMNINRQQRVGCPLHPWLRPPTLKPAHAEGSCLLQHAASLGAGARRLGAGGWHPASSGARLPAAVLGHSALGSRCTVAFLESSCSLLLRRALLSGGKQGPGHHFMRGHYLC